MNIAIIGSGAREHVIIEKCIESNIINNIITFNMKYYDIYKNNKIVNIQFDYSDNYKNNFYKLFIKYNVELVIIGPEKFLVDGIVDFLEEKNIKCFGPNIKGAQLEGSKCFSKDIMNKYEFITSPYCSFDNFENACKFFKNKYELGYQVIKVSGLASGKGVCVAESEEDGLNFIKDIFIENKFGENNHKVLIEQKLVGEEVSLMGFCNGKKIEFLHQAQDYKRLGDDNSGPNTGGMGAVSPVYILNDYWLKNLKEKCDKLVRDFGYIGILYLGILIDNGKPYVLEFNCRFGDPEAQVLLGNIKNDFGQLIYECVERYDFKLELDNQISLNVVCAHTNYTVCKTDIEEYPMINISDGDIEDNIEDNIKVFFADPYMKDRQLYSKGGRTLSIVGSGKSYNEAYKNVYNYIINNVKYNGLYFRSDIGLKFIIDNPGIEMRKYKIACIGEHIIDHPNIVLNIINDKYMIDPNSQEAKLQLNRDILIMPNFNQKLILNILKSYDIDYIIYNGNVKWNNDIIRNYYNGYILKFDSSCIYMWDKQWNFFAITRTSNIVNHILKHLNVEPLKYPVNIEMGNDFVEDLKKDSNLIGDFCAQMKFSGSVHGFACDGIGTKLDLALEYDKLDSIGIDLVAMNVNDLIVHGIKPKFFMDYIAIDKMDKDICHKIIYGVKEGCSNANCQLIGGETAEMSGIYMNGKFDVAGFAMGESIFSKSNGFNGFNEIKGNKVLVGFPSSGIHSNGFSLVRKVLKYYDLPDWLTIDDFLKPTKIYMEVLSIIENYSRETVYGFAHITGGGIIDNLPRIFDVNKFDYKINDYPIPKIFKWIQEKSKCSNLVMQKTFNNGIGIIGIFEDNDELVEILEKYKCFKLGVLVKKFP
jgi:phosphoribosylamine---glycine ligase